VLRREAEAICRPKREEEREDERKVQKEEFHKLYSSPVIIRMITLRSM
jgi:hypothetical protein